MFHVPSSYQRAMRPNDIMQPKSFFPFRQEPFGPMSQYVGDDTKDRWCMQFLDGDHRGILKLMKCGYDGEQLC